MLVCGVATGVSAQTPPPEETATTAEEDEEAQPPARVPALRAGELPRDGFVLDGVLSEAVWADVEAIENLLTVEPEEGGEPQARTVVKVLANAEAIVVGAVCYDPDPQGIVSFSKARDSDLENEDNIKVVFDTYRDLRTGYVFVVNPNGARFDGLIGGQGEDVNENWDEVWETKTSRDDTGWSVEIRIPIKSLGFRSGSNWGFNVERRVQRLQETSRWSGISQDRSVSQTSQAGILTNLPAFDLGTGLTIRPSLITGAVKESADANRDFTGDPSLDVTQKIGSNMLASLTVNTDFAETEVDTRQTNLTRFEIFFPEKRTFFLEGSDIFDFGMGLDETMVPFFSRRIGLFSGEEGEGTSIPINVGGKLNGRIGDTNVGALIVNTREVENLDLGSATMGAVRVKQNIPEESSVGMIATFGDQLGRTGSWATGADFVYETSEFLGGDQSFLAGFWGMVNEREDLEGTTNAWGFSVDYPNDRVNLALTTARIGEDFDPSLGFVPRIGVHVWEAEAEFNPRPSWSSVRQIFHESSIVLVNDLEGNWESYTSALVPIHWLFESGDSVQFEIAPEGDRPDEEFDVFDSEEETVVVPDGSYEWTRYGFSVAAADKRKLSGDLKWQTGGFYDGDLRSLEGNVALNLPLLTLELGLERNRGSLPDGEFTQSLYSGRAEVKVSPDLQVSSFIQFDNESDSLGTNTRLRWTFHPLGELFIVYNHNLLRSFNDRLQRLWNFESNELLVKLRYAWRF